MDRDLNHHPGKSSESGRWLIFALSSSKNQILCLVTSHQIQITNCRMGKKLESFILRSQYRNGTFKNIVSVSHCALYRFRLLEIGLIGPKNQQARGWVAEQLTNNRFRLQRVTSTSSVVMVYYSFGVSSW
ncbi:uncharacterized protein LOC108825881 isoform X1 [Raphanus sativus]|uniref:Uncharacterized protein LOC108825881 isoform X1 n=1 Tax=Raphanus sativus TaxID=3726 RepID=A0A6J0L4C9_RAPSA|nr:uncharacterized protein LOC108825881 isoform X1 [Raphanus sativus]